MAQLAPASPPQTNPRAGPGAEPVALRVLVVDDEEDIRLALSVCLESAGHIVVARRTIDGALEETSRQAFDLIFLDVRLGNDDGLEYLPARGTTPGRGSSSSPRSSCC